MKLTTIYGRDIPAQVIGQQGRTRYKQELSRRFAVAIDRAGYFILIRTYSHTS